VADDGNGIYAAARIQYSGSVAKNGGTGNVTSSDANWTPPPCWYVPYLGAKNCKKKMSKDLESQLNTPGMGGHADDSIGEPYAKGKADETQPCGVKYLRSSGDDTFKPRPPSRGGSPGPVPAAPASTSRTAPSATDVTVQEIQSINR
jgi:hypothetical protein